MSRAEVVGMTLDELHQVCSNLGYGMAEAKRCAYYLYRKGKRSFMDMELLPKKLRSELEGQLTISWHSPIKEQISGDGTKKYLFKTPSGNFIEAAFMPGPKRNTLCISTQAGCRMGCSFCHTATIGFRENLAASEILNQLVSIPERAMVNRIVFMGMGEPLDNFWNVKRSLQILTEGWGMAFGAANITVSTVGIPTELMQLMEARLCNIAVSLHSPFSLERRRLMPIEYRYPIEKTIAHLKQTTPFKPLRISFEYILIKDVNDTSLHALELIRILNGLKCHINLIPLNSHPRTDFVSPSMESARKFQRMLNSRGIGTTMRISRGEDVNAACGQFSASAKTTVQ